MPWGAPWNESPLALPQDRSKLCIWDEICSFKKRNSVCGKQTKKHHLKTHLLDFISASFTLSRHLNMYSLVHPEHCTWSVKTFTREKDLSIFKISIRKWERINVIKLKLSLTVYILCYFRAEQWNEISMSVMLWRSILETILNLKYWGVFKGEGIELWNVK